MTATTHELVHKPPGGGGHMPGVGWMCTGCEWRFSYDVSLDRALEVWKDHLSRQTVTTDQSAADDALFQARARLRRRIEEGLRSSYPVEYMMGIADSWADERADAQVAAVRERCGERLVQTARDSYQNGYDEGYRIARGQP